MNVESSLAAKILADQGQMTEGADAMVAANPLSANPAQGDFAGAMRAMVDAVSEKDRVAAERMQAVDAGQSDDLVGAMLASQDASLSFSMLMQVRNKVAGAIDELIKLQL